MTRTKMLFQTPRLSCRQWVNNDLDTIYKIYADEEGARWVGDGKPITREESLQWLEVTFNNYATRGYGMSTILNRSTHDIVGFCGLVHPGNQETPEIKYAFDKAYWGLGYASEVVPAMLKHGHSTHGLTHIIATVAKGNIASQRVLEKSQMVQTGGYEEDGETVLVFEWHANDT